MRPKLVQWSGSLLLALVIGGCGDPAPTGWIVDRVGDPPELLSDWGIYPAMDPAEPSSLAFAYEPRNPLWSNGTRKHRAFVLPEDATLAGSEDDWAFPPGTLLFKTFSDDDGPIETRVVEILAEGWSYRVFRWNEDRSEATMVGIDSPTEVAITVDGAAATHAVPSRRQCVTCHESAPSVSLGFGPYQRSDDLVGALASAGVLGAAPTRVAEVSTGDAASDTVVRYLQGNCVHCHNGIAGPANSFDLRPEVALANTVGTPTGSSAAEAGIRIVPGDPDESVLFRSFSGINELPMPPVGVQARDAAMVETMREWIEGLE
ncbi:MAG: hypothetical protein JJ863_37070 [Deltaproteobacteria bacterium]|nr:hypothetical protein [Deltaproteobacteria bacterium]